MNYHKLEVLLNDMESDRVERKASISDRGKLCEAICAFANDLPNHQQPGVLFIGVNDNGTCAYIQSLRINGTELTDPIKDQKEIGGALPDLLRMLDEIFQVNISVATDITAQPIELQQPDYPIVALQQLGRNAVMHRTYEGTDAPVRITWFNDRIEKSQ